MELENNRKQKEKVNTSKKQKERGYFSFSKKPYGHYIYQISRPLNHKLGFFQATQLKKTNNPKDWKMLQINKVQRERRERKQALFKGKNQTQQKRVPKTRPRKKYQCKSRMHSAVKSKEKGNTGSNDS